MLIIIVKLYKCLHRKYVVPLEKSQHTKSLVIQMSIDYKWDSKNCQEMN